MTKLAWLSTNFMSPVSVQHNRRAFLKLSVAAFFSMTGAYQIARQFFVSSQDLYSLSEVALPSALNAAERRQAVEAFLQWKQEAPARFLHPDWRDMQKLKFQALVSYRRPFSSLSPEAKKKVAQQVVSRRKNRENLVSRFSSYYFQSTDGINRIHNLKVDALRPRLLSESCYLPKELS